MQELINLLFGTMLLLFLSQWYHPVDTETRIRSRFRWDGFLVITVSWLSAFYFCRTSYNDTGVYIRSFLNAPTPAEFLASGGLLDLTGYPLFYFYQSLMRSVTDNYHLFFFFPAVLCNYALVVTLKRYSRTPGMSMMIYICVGTYVLYMAAMKQSVAFALLLLSIPYVLERKYVRFYLMILLAALFHTYAILFAFLPLLCGKPWNKRTWLLLAMALFALATYRSTLGVVLNYLQKIGAQATEEELFDDHSINALRVVVYLLPAAVALIFRGRLFYDSSRAENLFVNLSILSGLILMIGLAEGANLMARMAAFFEFATAICLPWMIYKLFTERSARLVTKVAGVCYFGYFLYEFMIAKAFDAGYRAISLWTFCMRLLGATI